MDARSGDLYRDGAAIRLQEQPLQTLLVLIEHAGHIVTHDHLRQRLWQNDASIDVDHGLRPILKRLRDALNDPADNPVFIETLPHRGYRFLVPVEAVAAVDGAVERRWFRARRRCQTNRTDEGTMRHCLDTIARAP